MNVICTSGYQGPASLSRHCCASIGSATQEGGGEAHEGGGRGAYCQYCKDKRGISAKSSTCQFIKMQFIVPKKSRH